MIAKRIGLNDVPDAHVFLEKGKARGPIVCIPWKRSPKILHENDHVPNEINADSPQEETREEEPDEPVEDKKESQKRRGIFRRRSKVHGQDENHEREDVLEHDEDEKSKKSKRSWRKKKEKKGQEEDHPDDEK